MAIENGRVHLDVREALQLAALEALASTAGFELEVGPVEWRRLTLRLDGVLLEEALSALLPDTPYSADYEFHRASGSHALTRLWVGVIPEAPLPPESTARTTRERKDTDSDRLVRARETRESLQRTLRGRRPFNGEHEREAFRENHAAWQAEVRRQLEDPDPEVRAEAVQNLDTDQPGARDHLIAMARADEDPAVRTAALESLGSDGSFVAVRALLDALNDPDPEIVLASLEALESAGDNSIIPRLLPYLASPNQEIADAVSDVVYYLE